jgi:DNA invertase Pin-like site-specific DNA recombinase
MKVAIYCRVSTEEQNPELQEQDLKNFCLNRNYEVYKVYTDIISGTKDSRPLLNDLMIDAYDNKFNGVVVWKLDRLGRSLHHLIDIVNKFKKWNVNLIIKTQDIDTSTSNGKLLFHIFGAVAEFERDLISERTKLAIKNNPLVGKRGKDKKPRKTGGYILRHNPHLRKTE